MTSDPAATLAVPPDANLPPLALDIDGTLTTPDHTVDPRVFEVLPAWPAPVVLATGKSFPYPIALCHFLGIPERVVAENGGVVCVDETVRVTGDADRVAAATEAFREAGGDLCWGDADTVNRWRETEVAASRDADADQLRAVAEEFDLSFIDTGYAYHLTDPAVSKGAALSEAAAILDREASEFVALGDSMNDASTFEVARESYAVANADETARAAADVVLEAGYMDGTLAALRQVIDQADG